VFKPGDPLNENVRVEAHAWWHEPIDQWATQDSTL